MCGYMYPGTPTLEFRLAKKGPNSDWRECEYCFVRRENDRGFDGEDASERSLRDSHF
eukprot:COSAG05_NODE_3238_length_2215_cov_1.879547_3_plen_57_part_00